MSVIRERTKSRVLFLFLLVHRSACFTFQQDLFEGSSCPMEDGSTGICKKLVDCEYRLKEVREGRRFSTSQGRCSFNGFMEIVCCPNEQSIAEKLGLRPADVACVNYENEIVGQREKTQNEVNSSNTPKSTLTRQSDGLKYHIFEGIEASPDEFPYMVALGYEKIIDNVTEIKYSCGGTLISYQHVLTAAHCVKNVNSDVPVEARLGSNDLSVESENVRHIKIANITAHPSYRIGKNYNDIAVLALKERINVDSKIQPICLQTKPIFNMRTLVNLSVIVTGWGATSFIDESSNKLLKTPSLELIDKEKCAEYYKGMTFKLPNGIDDNMLCVADGNITRSADACQGDSGGPLLLLSSATRTCLGVTSFGQNCGSAVPAVYTSVLPYLDWLEEVVWPEKKLKASFPKR